ncbi:hypothetical protein CWI42_080400 [Ordospora colligata]|nr:hypothetical protein CWI42_080400 [Ordospora colligata]
MNLVIERPSRVIKICIANDNDGDKLSYADKENRFRRKTEYETCIDECAVSDEVPLDMQNLNAKHHKNSMSIDFFELNEEASSANEYEDVDCSQYNRNRMIFGTKFIEASLKNDIRVKSTVFANDAIFVYFFTVNDSISFYEQFNMYAELSFSDLSGFEQILSMPFSEWTSLSLSTADGMCINDDCILDNYVPVEQCSPKHFSSNEMKNLLFPGTIYTELQDINPSKMYTGMYSTVESIVDHNKILNEIIFEKRCEYFLSIRNLFSRADLKSMVQAIEAGNTEFLFRNTKELAVGCKSNKILQEVIEHLSEENLFRIVENLGDDIAPIAANKHGAYVVQMLISMAKLPETQCLISRCFKRYGRFLITHEIGNYAIQKIIRFDADLIFEFFESRIMDVCNDELCVRILKRCMEFFSDDKCAILQSVLDVQERKPKA